MTDVKYRDIIAHLGILPGSTLMVAADLTRLAMVSRRKEGEFSISVFIDSILHFLGNDGTLVIPAYNFNLKNNSDFYPDKTIPITGAMAAEALKRKDFLRTGHPLHSFLVSGRHAPEMARLQNRSSFGPDSPFAFLLEEKCRMLFIDTRIKDAFTFIHYVEEKEKVKYRKFRRINLMIEDSSGNVSQEQYLIFAKRKGWTLRLDGLEQLLEENGLVKTVHINQASFSLLDISEAFPLIHNDIRRNKGHNIAFFSPVLYLREKAKQLLALLGIHTLADRISHDPGLL